MLSPDERENGDAETHGNRGGVEILIVLLDGVGGWENGSTLAWYVALIEV